MSLAANNRRSHRSKSLSPSPIKSSNQRTCKYNHSNKRIDTSNSSSFQCNDCKSKIKRYGIIYGCLRCKFYLCQPCFRKPSCQNGHLLKGIHAKRNTICSLCKYQSKKQRLQMYQCNLCKFNMCLGCYSYNQCSGNHGLKLIKIKQSTDKSLTNCKKCHRIFKINKSLFMCKKCKYSLCIDCYQPNLNNLSILSKSQNVKKEEFEEESKYEFERTEKSKSSKKKHQKYTKTQKKKSSKKKKVKTKSVQPNNGNTPSLTPSETSSINMPYNESQNDNELSSSVDLFGIESTAPSISEMTRIPSILTDCVICMEREKEVAFIPCGHYIACEKCATVLKNDIGMCAICSMKIQTVLRIYE